MRTLLGSPDADCNSTCCTALAFQSRSVSLKTDFSSCRVPPSPEKKKTNKRVVDVFASLAIAGGQVVVAGLQRDAGRDHPPPAQRPTDSALLRHLPAHSRTVHGTLCSAEPSSTAEVCRAHVAMKRGDSIAGGHVSITLQRRHMNNAYEINLMDELTLKGVTQYYAFVQVRLPFRELCGHVQSQNVWLQIRDEGTTEFRR